MAPFQWPLHSQQNKKSLKSWCCKAIIPFLSFLPFATHLAAWRHASLKFLIQCPVSVWRGTNLSFQIQAKSHHHKQICHITVYVVSRHVLARSFERYIVSELPINLAVSAVSHQHLDHWQRLNWDKPAGIICTETKTEKRRLWKKRVCVNNNPPMTAPPQPLLYCCRGVVRSYDDNRSMKRWTRFKRRNPQGCSADPHRKQR